LRKTTFYGINFSIHLGETIVVLGKSLVDPGKSLVDPGKSLVDPGKSLVVLDPARIHLIIQQLALLLQLMKGDLDGVQGLIEFTLGEWRKSGGHLGSFSIH
jgi:hypothetical protein